MSDVEEEVEPVTPTLSVNVSDTDGLAWLFTRTARVVAKAADPWWKETETQSEAVCKYHQRRLPVRRTYENASKRWYTYQSR